MATPLDVSFAAPFALWSVLALKLLLLSAPRQAMGLNQLRTHVFCTLFSTAACALRVQIRQCVCSNDILVHGLRVGARLEPIPRHKSFKDVCDDVFGQQP
jgi:hypothetical protein